MTGAASRVSLTALPGLRHAKSRSLIIPRQIGGRDRRGIAISHRMVMRRQDLYARLVESVLNVLVQIAIDHSHPAGLIRICIDLIGNIEIIQAGLQYERLRVLENTGRARRRLDQ